MKTIIAGSRNINNYSLLCRVMKDVPWEITEVVCGKARGVDTLGERWAHEHGIPVKEFPADWDTHGKAAGPIRNKQMAEYADALVALRLNKSAGTTHMINTMIKMNKRVYWEDFS
jgi:hypothetical protein